MTASTGRGRGRGRGVVHNTIPSSSLQNMGGPTGNLGRGRGRGGNINLPAWMTSNSNNRPPSSQLAASQTNVHHRGGGGDGGGGVSGLSPSSNDMGMGRGRGRGNYNHNQHHQQHPSRLHEGESSSYHNTRNGAPAASSLKRQMEDMVASYRHHREDGRGGKGGSSQPNELYQEHQVERDRRGKLESIHAKGTNIQRDGSKPHLNSANTFHRRGSSSNSRPKRNEDVLRTQTTKEKTKDEKEEKIEKEIKSERQLEQEMEDEKELKRLAMELGYIDDDNKHESDNANDVSQNGVGVDKDEEIHSKLKRQQQNDDDDEEDIMVFESEEEREARMAKERRERRKKRLGENHPLGDENVPTIMMESSTKKRTRSEDSSLPPPTKINKVVEALPSSSMSDEMSLQNDASNNFSNNEMNISNDDNDDDLNDGKNSFDIFFTSVSPPNKDKDKKLSNHPVESAAITTMSKVAAGVANDAGNYDDAEGYYRANLGEVITFHRHNVNIHRDSSQKQEIKFKVLGIIGKGVFSTVLKCACLRDDTDIGGGIGNQQQVGSEQEVVAMKLIRNNETMAKAAQKEVRILRLLCFSSASSQYQRNRKQGKEESGGQKESDEAKNLSASCIEEQERNHYIVRMLDLDIDFTSDNSTNGDEKQRSLQDQQYYHQQSQQPLLEYRSHTTLLFEHLPYNLRETLSKFGKNVGINLNAVRSYAKQLFTALSHLAIHRIVHADIKPDNILVSANFSTVKLCDFGSAFFETDAFENDPTPYLVSRFYRAPEVILGLEYDRMVDLWSVAVTLAELFTGSVLFPGRTNNDMLRRFMERLGPFSNKMIRRHVASYTTKLGLPPHFEAVSSGGSYNFRRKDVDKVTGHPVVRVVSGGGIAIPAKQIAQVLLRARSGNDERGDVLKFAEFLNRCLALDPGRRISVNTALMHDFFVKKKR